MPNKFYNQSWFNWLILIIITAGLGWFFYTQFYVEPVDWGDDEKSELGIKNQEMDIEVIDNGDGTKTVRNVGENIQLVVDEEWDVKSKNLVDEKILVEKLGENNLGDTGIQEGIYIQVYTFNNLNKDSIKDFVNKEWGYSYDDVETIFISGVDVFRDERKVSFGDENSYYYKDDSLIIDFSFVEDDKVITYSCTAIGLNLDKYKKECEQILTNNIK